MGLEPNLLVISDLHLGERLGRGRDPDPRTEQALVDFVRHHTHTRRDGRPWRLVINGDAVDLVGMCLMPHEADQVAGLEDNDHLYGLGEQALASALKLSAVVHAHADVFRALAAFLGAGNDVVMVVGNHDAELHWPATRALLKRSLATYWGEEPASEADGALTGEEVAARLSVHDWFYLEDGVAWIEHGHQYDPYCSFEEVLEPSTDEHRIDPNVGAAILRYVANHFTSDASEHWGSGFMGYLGWWVGQGLDKALDILGGYRDMVFALVAHWWARRPERLAARRSRVRTRLTRLAKRFRLTPELLARLAAHRHEPVVTNLRRIVQAVMLDRLLLLFATPFLLALPVLLPWAWMPWSWSIAFAVWGVWGVACLVERESTDPRQSMRRMATRIRAAVQVPIVVMGHSHDPCAEVGDDGAYFNTGTWVPHGEGLQAFTHVLITRTRTGAGTVARAMLCQWRDGRSQEFGVDPVSMAVQPQAAK